MKEDMNSNSTPQYAITREEQEERVNKNRKSNRRGTLLMFLFILLITAAIYGAFYLMSIQ